MTRTSSSTPSRRGVSVLTIVLAILAAVLILYWVGTIAGATQKCADGGIIVRTLWGYDCIKEGT